MMLWILLLKHLATSVEPRQRGEITCENLERDGHRSYRQPIKKIKDFQCTKGKPPADINARL